MYPSDEYLVYANGVDAICYSTPTSCYYDVKSGKYGMPTTGWIYNSNNLEGQSGVYSNWFVSPYSGDSIDVLTVKYEGYIHYNDNAGGDRPVLYLSSNVKITGGTGEITNLYKLRL